MNRRSFLSSLLASGALYGTGALAGHSAHASGFANTSQRMLVSVLLSGAPDFRHMLPPVYSEVAGSYSNEYWQAMAASHGLGESASALQSRFNTEYDTIGNDQVQFGLLKSCGWLKNMWDNGNVAIVNNVLGSSSRNHPVSVMVSELGNREVTSQSSRAPGIGGRLADLSARNVLSLTSSPRQFCYGASASDASQRSTRRVVSARDTRSFTLFDGDPAQASNHMRSEITRNITGYYAAKQNVGNPGPSAAIFLEHERKLRDLGAPINERLSSLPIPDALARLYNPNLSPLYKPEFGLQIRNLYDSLACADILNMGIASLEYKGFDSHRLQIETLEPRLHDLFGERQALDSLYNELPTTVSDELVFAFSGEFGRQIRANGDGGTDHGEGLTMLIVGKPVTGGVYGDLFPQSELALREHPSPQIEGLTAIERVNGVLANWYSPGSASTLFPGLNQSPLESGFDLSAILPSA